MNTNEDKKEKFIKDWSLLKIKIHFSSLNKKYFLEREIWWAGIGSNVGHEEDGKNKGFERPVLILKKFNKYLILIVPLSSKIKIDNKYYCTINLSNIFSSVIISQLRVLSAKRLIRKMDKLDKIQFQVILNKISFWW